MAIKKLQNDFTTPEQSKRLLELGLPQDSANMILDGYIDSANRWVPDQYPRYLEHPYSVEIKNESELYTSNVLPCWSVGRLIEIFDMCYQREPEESITEHWILTQEATENFGSYIEYLVQTFSMQKKFLNFSKLEE